MKKLLLLALLFPLIISAQHEFGYHATWWYRTFYPFYGYYDYKKVEHVGDTTLVGLNWLEFEVTGKRVRKTGLGMYEVEVLDSNLKFPSIYLASRNDSVFRLLNDTTPYLLYDFSAEVGDKWQFAPHDSMAGCDSTPVATVTDLEIDTISGHVVSYLRLKFPMDTLYGGTWPKYQVVSPYLLSGRVYREFGGKYMISLFTPDFNFCDGTIVEYGDHSLVCFSNDSISLTVSREDCSWIRRIGLLEKAVIRFEVFPNPTNGSINIHSDERVVKVEVYSLDGQKLIETTQADNIELPISSGIYMVAIYFEDGRTGFRKISKD